MIWHAAIRGEEPGRDDVIFEHGADKLGRTRGSLVALLCVYASTDDDVTNTTNVGRPITGMRLPTMLRYAMSGLGDAVPSSVRMSSTTLFNGVHNIHAGLGCATVGQATPTYARLYYDGLGCANLAADLLS